MGCWDEAFGLLHGFLMDLVDLLLLLLCGQRVVSTDALDLGLGGFHDGLALLYHRRGDADLLPASNVSGGGCARWGSGAGWGGLGLLAHDGCGRHGYAKQYE